MAWPLNCIHTLAFGDVIADDEVKIKEKAESLLKDNSFIIHKIEDAEFPFAAPMLIKVITQICFSNYAKSGNLETVDEIGADQILLATIVMLRALEIYETGRRVIHRHLRFSHSNYHCL